MSSSYPSLKLTYFDVHGRAEFIRLLLSYSNIPFEDYRIWLTDLPSLIEAKKLPFKQVPTLEVDGEILTQSLAIAQYVADLSDKFKTTSALEKFRISSINHVLMEEVYAKVAPTYYFKKGQEQEEAYASYLSTAFPKAMKGLEEQAASSCFFFNTEEPTTVDLHLFTLFGCGLIETIPGFSFEEYPKIKGIVEKVAALPAIKAYMEKRPVNKTGADV